MSGTNGLTNLTITRTGIYLEWSELGISVGSFFLVLFGLFYNRKFARELKKGYKPLMGSIRMNALSAIGPSLLSDTDTTYISIPSQDQPAANSTVNQNPARVPPPPPQQHGNTKNSGQDRQSSGSDAAPGRGQSAASHGQPDAPTSRQTAAAPSTQAGVPPPTMQFGATSTRQWGAPPPSQPTAPVDLTGENGGDIPKPGSSARQQTDPQTNGHDPTSPPFPPPPSQFSTFGHGQNSDWARPFRGSWRSDSGGWQTDSFGSARS